MLADFIITVHETRKPLAVQVKVHDDVKALRSAAARYTNRANLYGKKNDPDFSDTLGICHRFHISNTPLCAIVRLAPPNIGAGVVAHEMAHAAVWMWEIQNKFSRKDPLQCDNDEWFCWVLGELVRQTTIKLYDDGVY
jgi:hypothetical protein